MFEVVRYNRPSAARALAQRLTAISNGAMEREAEMRAVAGLVPEAMATTAALTALGVELSRMSPEAEGRISFILDVATVALAEIATERR